MEQSRNELKSHFAAAATRGQSAQPRLRAFQNSQWLIIAFHDKKKSGQLIVGFLVFFFEQEESQ